MSNEAIDGLANLPELLDGLSEAAGKLDAKMAANALATLEQFGQLIPILKENLGESFDAKVAMQLLDQLLPRALRISLAEILVRGDIAVRENIEAEAGLTAGFSPYVSFTAAGAYHQSASEAWGTEVRVTLAAVPADKELIAEIMRRAQERDAKDPSDLAPFLQDVYPIITELFGSKAGTANPD